MPYTITIAIVAAASYWIYLNVAGFCKNLAAARRSGLPYIITPVNLYNTLWLMTHRIFLPLIGRLPSSWTESWAPYLWPDWVWDLLWDPFEKHGDVFLSVSPGAIHVWLANAEAIRQVAARREAFPKPLESYRILEIFGRNLISTEGNEWKAHRKVMAPGFNEKNNVLVFAEACRQTQGMLRKWISGNESGSATIEEVPIDTMRLTLHIISRVGFGVTLLWPGEKASGDEDKKSAALSSNEPGDGYTMSFERSISTLLEHLIWVLLVPKWILKHIPNKGASKAYESFINWGKYMNEIFDRKVEETRDGEHGDGMDIMGTLVRSSYGDSKIGGSRKSSPGRAEKGEVGKPVLSDSDILGNAFVMIVAGHETTSNSIHFSLIELAINPKSQRAVHKEVQSIFGNERPEKWDYDSNINTLLGGMIGAVLNEQLRLMPPVIAIPKQVSKHRDQTINLDGKQVTLPAGALVALTSVCAHRNPKYWPTQPSLITDRKDDLNDFRPERWLVKSASSSIQQSDSATESEDEDFGGFTGEDTSAQLFRPVRGSYLPFSEGPRSCIGRRLAQVKIMAVLAVIFQNYCIELAVDEWATDDEVAKMSDDERRKLYAKAQKKARATIRTASSMITLKLHEGPGFIPVRVVKKGEERFVHIVE